MTVQKLRPKKAAMTRGGSILGAILQELLDMSEPGVMLSEIEDRAQQRIKEAGGTPSFMTVEGYRWATCICVDDVIVHGIPTRKKLKDGSLLTIDIGMVLEGYHTDTAWTKIVSNQQTTDNKQLMKFLDTGKTALKNAIEQARVGNRIGHISKAIEDRVRGNGYGIVQSLIGHGVGEELHMPPQIPGIVRGDIGKTPAVTEGMSLAIEVIYTMGNPAVYYPNDDGWSIATRDGSLSAVFEQTILVTDGKPVPVTPTHPD